MDQGLTPFALFFMLLSMGSVTALMIYCFWRILAEPDTADGTGSTSPAEEDAGRDDGAAG